MAESMHVAVVEADPIYREGLLHTIEKAGFRRFASCASVSQLLAMPTSGEGGSLLILMDVGDDPWSIGSHVAALRRRFTMARIVVIADAGTERFLLSALQSGADGLLMKPIGCDTLVKSLELVMLGERIFPAHFIKMLSEDLPAADHADETIAFDKLSAREIDVLQELSSGSPNKVIARHFGITEATVKVHVKAILRKLPARNRTEAAIWARTHMMGADALSPGRSTVQPTSLKAGTGL